MGFNWAGSGSAITAAFLASFVEFVEALTIVLAVGVTRGWTSALAGTVVAASLLTLAVATLGSVATQLLISTAILQLILGSAMLLFGMRWLRKATLRSAGLLGLHDEAAAFEKTTSKLRQSSRSKFDFGGFATSFQAVLIEGTEVVFIVIATGAAAKNIAGASLGAAAAAVLVLVLGLLLHRPLTRVPENTLKFCVGALLSSFGTFWTGEALHVGWPGGDWALLWLIPSFLIVAGIAVGGARPSILSKSVSRA